MLEPGTQIGPYEIISLLGAGGMGEVYRARDPRLARTVALKVLPPEVAEDAGRRQRFEQEARAASALNHPNILSVYDMGSQDGLVYIVSELIDGREPARHGEARARCRRAARWISADRWRTRWRPRTRRTSSIAI